MKPENILVNDSLDAYLCDFGFSLDLASTESKHVAHLGFGTRGYQSPELICQSDITVASDTYSFGGCALSVSQ